jgi:KUP system potassium uptake protein
MHEGPTSTRRLALLAIGVVYGDIGTSPLYAFRTALAVAPDMGQPDNVLGILSLIVWALIVVVCVKYCGVILNADNRGEGGVLALSTLVLAGRVRFGRAALGITGMLGAALFFADGALTPAISVLSAVEGLTVGWPGVQVVVVPLTLLILFVLFRMQSRGTAAVGTIFGPVMVVWFLVLAVTGIVEIARQPYVLLALDPTRGLAFVGRHQGVSLAIFGAVFLAVTGGEALYADLGHFGKTPIRHAWYGLVFPALVLNYLGQGALVLTSPASDDNPFFLMVPGGLLVPLVVLATAATVIASQAVLSGVFSVVHQAVRLSYLPRLEILHSSEKTFGQVYVTAANVALGVVTAGLVLAFGSSSALAGAYGIAVAAVMVIATVLTLIWMAQRNVSRVLYVLMMLIFIVDVSFLTANLTKLDDGGWVPIAIAALLFLVMNTWTRGRVVVSSQIARERHSVRELAERIATDPPQRTRGIAVFLASNPEGVPRALWHNLQCNNVLHEQVILLTFLTEEVPRVSPYTRAEISELMPGITRVVARYGFMETPSATDALNQAARMGVRYARTDAIFFVGTESVFYGKSALGKLEKRLFAYLLRNSRRAAGFYEVPESRLMEFGSRLGV